jgi:predicted small secreted protein
MKSYLKVILVSMVCAWLSAGCNNTVQGFGKDMENGGQEIQKAVSTKK